MITYWLVVSLSIAGGDWQILENTKMPSREACVTAAIARLERSETMSLLDEQGHFVGEEREVVVACSIHWPKEEKL